MTNRQTNQPVVVDTIVGDDLKGRDNVLVRTEPSINVCEKTRNPYCASVAALASGSPPCCAGAWESDVDGAVAAGCSCAASATALHGHKQCSKKRTNLLGLCFLCSLLELLLVWLRAEQRDKEIFAHGFELSATNSQAQINSHFSQTIHRQRAMLCAHPS
jgi:hypothetical protein